MSFEHLVPGPPAFLDPMTEINMCYFYAVPKYCSMSHTNTRWLITVIRNNRLDMMKRKMEVYPDMFRDSYYQLMDIPKLYNSKDPSIKPLFNKKAVLYMTPLGMAIYLKNAQMVQLILEYRDPADERLYNLSDPQYATHVLDTVYGDFHAYPISVIVIRMGLYVYLPDLLRSGWNSFESICMPSRRRYERRALYFHDWLDYALYLMHDTPMLALPKLVHYMTSDPLIYKYLKLPITAISPETNKNRVKTGIIDVEELPIEAQMQGVQSLLEMAEKYLLYLQTKERYKMVKDCITQMVSEGINPQVMMAHAMDYDGYLAEERRTQQTEQSTNANNNAATVNNSASKRKKRGNLDEPYASEPTRILFHALQCNAKPSNKTPLLPLLDTVAIYIRRHVYLINPPTRKKSKKGGKGSAANAESDKNAYKLRKRDAKNSIVLMLNLMQQQYSKLDKLNAALRSKSKRKFAHLDSARQASNKLIYLTRVLKRIAYLLFHVLLNSGELLDFVEATFPLFSQEGEIDFKVNPNLGQRLRGIQLEVMSEFSRCKTALNYFNLESIQRATAIKEMFVNLHVGLPPTEEQMKQAKPTKRHKTSNANALPEPSAVLASQRNTSSDACYLFSSDGGGAGNVRDGGCAAMTLYDVAAAMNVGSPKTLRLPRGNVTFVKIKRKLPVPTLAEASKQPRRSKSGDNQEAAEAAEEKDVDQVDITTQLLEQIDQLRRSANPANAAQAEIYQRILDDLLAAVSQPREKQQDEEKEEAVKLAEETEPVAQSDQPMELHYCLAQRTITREEEEVEASATADQPEAEPRRLRDEAKAAEDAATKDLRPSATAPVPSKRRTVRWRGRATRGAAGGGRNYQKARIYESPVFGTEFDLLS